MTEPATRRILIIVGAVVGALLVMLALGWCACAAVRKRSRARSGGGAGGITALGEPPPLQQQFIAGGGGGGGSTASSSSASGATGRPAGSRPLWGGGSSGRRLANPFAGSSLRFGRPQQQPHNQQPSPLPVPFSLAPPPPAAAGIMGRGASGLGTVPAGGYTVAGRTFASLHEAEEYQMALALQRSLREQQQMDVPGGAAGRYLPSYR